MNPPSNPHQAEFNSAWREAMQAAGVISAQPAASIPAHALALYPWLAKHAATARIEMMNIYNPHTQRYERGPVVTVTV